MAETIRKLAISLANYRGGYNEETIHFTGNIKDIKQYFKSEADNLLYKKRCYMKLTQEDINNLIGIKESFELPDKLMKLLRDKETRIKLFNDFMKYDIDLSNDVFRDYFQEEHADRKGLKQDYTPDCICQLLSKIHSKADKVLDVCSGTGSLSIFTYNTNKEAYYQCEEISSRAIPVLLFNLAIRGINGLIIQKDVLKDEILHIYKLTNYGQISDIEEINEINEEKFDLVISNPPYSIPWEPKQDERFAGYELAPKSKADYAFVLNILYKLDKSGEAFIILPHGILFRGQAEGEIRKQLIENNLIDSVIGLPDKLFLNTSIPVVILVLKKNRKTKDILFIDSSKNCIKQSKQNDMNEEQIDKIVNTFRNRKEIEKYSHLATYKEIVKNDYNLNIPRYVNTFEKEPLPDLKEVVLDIINIEKEVKESEKELKGLLEELEGTTPEEKEYYAKAIRPMMEWLG